MSPVSKTEREPLAALLWPRILARVRVTTRLLNELAEVGACAWDAQRCAAFEEATRASRRLGWVLGVLASAAGTELLLARREPRGLEPLLELLAEGLASEGRALAPARAPLPRLAPSVCLLYTSPSPRDQRGSRMPSSA